jgi:hypothetical protein
MRAGLISASQSGVTRVRRVAVWDLVQFATNGVIFVLLGEQMPQIARRAAVVVQDTGHRHWVWLVVYIVAINLVLGALRLVWVWISLRLTLYRAARRTTPFARLATDSRYFSGRRARRHYVGRHSHATTGTSGWHPIPGPRPCDFFGGRGDHRFNDRGQSGTALSAYPSQRIGLRQIQQLPNRCETMAAGGKGPTLIKRCRGHGHRGRHARARLQAPFPPRWDCVYSPREAVHHARVAPEHGLRGLAVSTGQAPCREARRRRPRPRLSATNPHRS